MSTDAERQASRNSDLQLGEDMAVSGRLGQWRVEKTCGARSVGLSGLALCFIHTSARSNRDP